jgi:type IV pilus assembly protein PilC
MPRRLVSNTELLTLTRHLSAMLGAGIPIITAFTICADRSVNSCLSDALIAARELIRNGATVSSSLDQHPSVFNPIYRAMVRAGESAGILEETLHRVSTDLAAQIALRRHIISVALYPAVVLVTLVGITLLLLIWVVPTFEELFADSGARLPWLTRMVVSLSYAISSYGPPLAIIGCVTTACAGRYFKQSGRIKEQVLEIALRLPLLGNVLTLRSSIRICYTLGALIQSGVPIIDALATTSSVAENSRVAKELERARNEIANGSSLSDALLSSSAMYPDVIHYVAVGERAGRLEVMLCRCAEQLEQDLRDLVTRLQQMIEPALLLSIGVIVGTLLLAMYLPIFQIGELISH